MIAVLPAAGRGTRMQSVTGGSPKEALTLRGVSVLEHVIHAAEPLVDSVLVVWRESKGPVPGGYSWLPQVEMEGLAPAIASPYLGASPVPADRTAVLLPDTVFFPEDPLSEMARLEADIVIALEQVAPERVTSYGIVELDGDRILRIIEKPAVEEAPSNWAVSARYIFSKQFMEYLCEQLRLAPSQAGELPITGFIQSAIDRGMSAKGVRLGEKTRRFDCGNPEGYRQAKEVFEGEVAN